LLRAVREKEKGVTSRKGNRLFDENNRPYYPSVVETALRAGGFRSSEVATVQARRWEQTKEGQNFKERRARIYEIFRDYLSTRDPDAYSSLLEEIKAYNKNVKSSNANVPVITTAALKAQAKRFIKPTKRKRLLDY